MVPEGATLNESASQELQRKDDDDDVISGQEDEEETAKAENQRQKGCN